MRNALALFALTSSLAFSSGFEEGIQIFADFDRANHPNIFFSKYDSQFSSEGSAMLEKLPWSDTFWPRYEGGISYRWQALKRIFEKDLPVGRNLTRKDRRELSAAEKFDLLNGDQNFSFTRKVLKENPSNAPGWQGICDGWAEASINYQAARPVTLMSPSGEPIDFGASDIHALLSYHEAKIKNEKTKFLSRRCRRRWWGERGCDGMNPGAFHIVLLEALRREQSFVVDIDKGEEVWNQPVAGHEYKAIASRPPSEDSAKTTDKEVLVEMVFSYVSEAGPTWEQREWPNIYRMKLLYWLELDSNNQIVGGSWSPESADRIDFAWTRAKGELRDDFKKLLYSYKSKHAK